MIRLFLITHKFPFEAQGKQPVPGHYRGTSLIRNGAPIGPYRRTEHRTLWWPKWGWQFLMARYPFR
jgi:hypothetical protein